ncbi:hypothetical protein COU62_00565 [Candidatus Pacearchaeota archaeon CG10_big_fil_rev_8_21_14_0_10_35_219]|nr:VWA domain-containing protein [Candidatus Pacearchaeota archaeon]OIO42693.1 MAG: hypothetical protein AUJ63_02160 [Candidatus Pacearchaeota archaeon CG1_02_35_32]PIO08283.1 MAG: hypothetical protein COU62_00565 [Candidatus Pacearchaeota archaeon CG10_big_fil_rev_8_21_14_0_10_35_219]PIY81884.1 MAG: hypothetical protein COY79_00305 [Candidatus Pacearchaeota archaeon CG_4_10_14_0_8_um_filter_35_169]PIZ79375.1 MAG: hypothetical protein COY00_04330 [Candidatus Pacearchaeota archaeon CG_4_10_14_0_
MGRLKKRGIFFSIDALVALAIIFMIIIVAYPISQSRGQQSQIHEDLLATLSTLTIQEAITGNPAVEPIVVAAGITDYQKSVLETIGIIYASNESQAAELAKTVLIDIETTENVGLWYGTTLLWSTNSTYSDLNDATYIDTARQIISGVQAGGNVTGYSARAFLTSSLRDKYYYFGGYVGDGNISRIVEYNGSITSAKIEGVISDTFTVKVNGVEQPNSPWQGAIDKFTPKTYQLDTSTFTSGENTIEIIGTNLFIAGGFVKVTYDAEIEYATPIRYNFPGIEGLINLYDGFYVPNTLEEISVKLHMNSSQINTIMTIGNVTVYNDTTNDEETIYLSPTQIGNILGNLDELSNKTIPIRLGLENGTYVVNVSLDIVSLTDKSTNMQCDQLGGCQSNKGQCEGCNPPGAWLLPLNMSRDSNTLLIEEILKYDNTNVSIYGFHSSVATANKLPLTKDKDYLLYDSQKGVTNWDSTYTSGGHKMCNGILSMGDEFIQNSDPDAKKVGIVQSAGFSNLGCGLTSDDLNGDGIFGDAGDDSVKAACDLYNAGVVDNIYTIGYGSEVDELTLMAIADCADGQYYYSDISELVELYQKIIDNIIANYREQTAQSSPEVYTRLYPDSYIEFNYTIPNQEYGLLISTEKQFDDSYSGTFEIPLNSTLIEAQAISYSGARWTKELYLNNENIFNITSYGNDYIILGDPYALILPKEKVISGEISNPVYLTTGSSPVNTSEGSIYNKIIYTISRNVTAYSSILTKAEGCLWTVEFESGNPLEGENIPDSYSGSNECFYDTAHMGGGQVQNENDAYQIAVRNLLRQLDLNNDNKIDVRFTEQSLKIAANELIGIPFEWQTEVQVRVWR